MAVAVSNLDLPFVNTVKANKIKCETCIRTILITVYHLGFLEFIQLIHSRTLKDFASKFLRCKATDNWI